MTATQDVITEELAADEQRPTRIPRATYRLQFNSGFTFGQARAIVAYLDALGVSDLYASPLFRASPDSTHGYDIANHNQINPVLGGEAEFDALAAELNARNMGLLLDTVPNHMGIGEPSNEWWMDVLENGPSSIYAPYFDIDWQPVTRELENKVLLPILGQQFGRVLEQGELRLTYEHGMFFLDYYDHRLPVNPRSYRLILQHELEALRTQLDEATPDLLEYESILTGLSNLPMRTETEPARVAERNREKEILKRRLDTLASGSEPVQAAIAEAVRQINGTPGQPRSFDLLEQLVDWQAYRLTYWRVAAEEINYRRFFDVNDLAAIRMEREDVFLATHKLLMQLFAQGKLSGIRLDHTDGLYDPAGYFARLQQAFAEANSEIQNPALSPQPSALSPQPSALPARPLYLLTEKILARGEPIPPEWAIYGTTGYDFLNAANSVFVDTAAERRFSEIYSDFVGRRMDFDELTYQTRRQIMRVSLASELLVLATALNRVAERTRYYRDFTLNSLREALREVIACFPVYRTYTVAASDTVGERDRQVIEQTVARSRRRNPAAEPSIYEFIRDVLLLRYPDHAGEADRAEQREFVMRFQQLTGPVMAKGLEDTAFYIYNRLISLNEVGGEPRHFGGSVAAFHRQNSERLRDWPHAMLCSSTHDTKRSEDVRARINLLSEVPEQWRTLLTRLARLNQRKKTEIEGVRAPDRNDEYLLYQTVLGTLPLDTPHGAALDEYVARIQAYMAKAIREAKVHTSWLNQNTQYNEATA
ncbi:MAG: malto-oligosyltrehalose synthase, partial [Roseiflexaceae bacterium]|nr:malto-oligosyltrehalose synthase [Roseiflexaceae bacterium]